MKILKRHEKDMKMIEKVMKKHRTGIKLCLISETQGLILGFEASSLGEVHLLLQATGVRL